MNFNSLQFLNDDNYLLQAEDLIYKKFPTISVHFYEYAYDFFQHLLKIRMIPSPAKHKQTKNTQQQIHSHLKKVHVSRFPVILNEAIQELNSVVVDKHTQSSEPLHKTVNLNERPPKLVQSRYLENNILKQTAPEKFDKVLSKKFYAEFTKRNGDTYELESLKIMKSAIKRSLKEKTIHG